LNVCQTMFTVLKTGKMDRFMDDLEVRITISLLVALKIEWLSEN